MISKSFCKIKYFIPSFVTMILFSCILWAKGIFPFGEKTIDYYDMAQQIAAFYYHIYDVLHGEKSLFFDWYTALGVNMAMSTSGCSQLSVFHIFFLFVPRDMLLESLSIFHMLKMMSMAFTMYYYLHKTRKAPYFFQLAFSVGYAFSGFVLMLYITNQWMDIGVFFPLLMLGVWKVYKEGKVALYVGILTLSLINSYYLTFMILLYVFLRRGLSIVCFRDKERNFHLWELGLGTLSSLCLSAFIVLPQLLQTMESARFGSGREGGILSQYVQIIRQVQGAYTTRWFTLLGLSLAGAVIVKGWIQCKKEKRILFFTGANILIITLELFFESINLLWHFGSYVQYPIRNGFIINFVVLETACFFAGRIYGEAQGSFQGHKKGKILIGTLASFVIGGVGMAVYSRFPGLPVRRVFHVLAIVCIIAFLLYIVWLHQTKWSVNGIIFLLAGEILFYSFIFFGKPDFITGYGEEPEQEGEYIFICNQISHAFEMQPTTMERIKNPDTSLNANYGLVLRQPALSNWTHLISPSLHEGASKWGYSRQFTRLLDAGGTVFSDALLGVTRTISRFPLEQELYKEIDRATVIIDRATGETATYYLYENQYTLPFGVVISKEKKIEKTGYDFIDLHNQMFERLAKARSLEDMGELIQVLYEEKDGALYGENLQMKVKGKKALYLSGAGGDREEENIRIFVNGKAVGIPTIKNMENLDYPAHFNNNGVFLGIFENQEVELFIQSLDEKGRDYEILVSSLDMNKLQRLCQAYEEYEGYAKFFGRESLIEVTASKEGEILLLPIAFDKGWTVEVNGRRRDDIREEGGLFTGIPLEKGENQVVMKFLPFGMKWGGSISGITFIILFIGGIQYCKKKKRNREWPVLIKREEGIRHVYMALWYIIITAMYAAPVFTGILWTIWG